MIKIEFKSQFKQFELEYNDNELSIIESNIRTISSQIVLSDKMQTEYSNNILELKSIIKDNVNFNVSGYIQITTNRKVKQILNDTNYKELLNNVLDKLTTSKGLISLCKNYIKYNHVVDENVNEYISIINNSNSLDVNEKFILNINLFEFHLYDINKPNELNINNDLYELNKFISKFIIVDNDNNTLNKISHAANNLNIFFKLSYYDTQIKCINTLICKLHKLDSVILLQSVIINYYNIIKNNNILTPKETRGRKEGMLVGVKYKKHKTKD